MLRPCDAQGSVRALSSGSATLSDQYSYTAFGEIRSQTGSSPQPYGYTGQQRDAATGLYYLRARYYAPGMGRFLSRDTWPIQIDDPQEINRYGYVANNPINYTDPSGRVMLSYAGGLRPSIQGSSLLYGLGTLVAGGTLASFCAVQDCTVLFAAKQKSENHITIQVKITAKETGRDPCDILREMYNSATSSKEKEVIKEAQKFMGCRRSREGR